MYLTIGRKSDLKYPSTRVFPWCSWYPLSKALFDLGLRYELRVRGNVQHILWVWGIGLALTLKGQQAAGAAES